MALSKDEKIIWKKRQRKMKRSLLKGKKLKKFEVKEIRKLNIKREDNPRVKLYLYLKGIYRWFACKF